MNTQMPQMPAMAAQMSASAFMGGEGMPQMSMTMPGGQQALSPSAQQQQMQMQMQGGMMGMGGSFGGSMPF
jgi:hypothetical protein